MWNSPHLCVCKQNPYRVLDAPNLPDDFYLNLVDWSRVDCVAVGIRGSVVIWNAKTAATEVVFNKTSSTVYEVYKIALTYIYLYSYILTGIKPRQLPSFLPVFGREYAGVLLSCGYACDGYVFILRKSQMCPSRL